MPPSPDPDAELSRALTPVADLATAVTGLPVVHDWGEEGDGGAVLLRPLALSMDPGSALAARQQSGTRLTLDLLVAAVGLPPFDAAATTTSLALALAEQNDWLMETERTDAAMWQALGQAPVPAVILRVPVRRIVERPLAPLVRQPLRIGQAHLRSVVGRVVWSDGTPVVAARVFPTGESRAATVTDRRGRFRLPVATVEQLPLRVTVVALGAPRTFEVEPGSGDASGDLGDLTVAIPESD